VQKDKGTAGIHQIIELVSWILYGRDREGRLLLAARHGVEVRTRGEWVALWGCCARCMWKSRCRNCPSTPNFQTAISKSHRAAPSDLVRYLVVLFYFILRTISVGTVLGSFNPSRQACQLHLSPSTLAAGSKINTGVLATTCAIHCMWHCGIIS
jgi:hypothetical protein